MEPRVSFYLSGKGELIYHPVTVENSTGARVVGGPNLYRNILRSLFINSLDIVNVSVHVFIYVSEAINFICGLVLLVSTTLANPSHRIVCARSIRLRN